MAATAVCAGLLAFAAPSGADVSSVGGGAFGQSVDVSLLGGPPAASGPLPSVSLPSSGGSVADAAPSVVVGAPGTSTPFGGTLLETGALSVDSEGSTGSSGSSASTASVATVDALGGTLTAAGVSSTCTSDETGSTGSAALAGGSLVVSGAETVALPADPAPNTTITGTHAESDTFTVILNEQQVAAGSITVNAVRVVLEGPSAAGDIILAQSRCARTATAMTVPPATAPPATAPPTTEPPATEPPATEPPAATAPTTELPTTEPPTTEPPAAPPPPETAELTSAPGGEFGRRATAGADVSKVGGGAFGFSSSISLFGGPAATRGPTPTVTLPESGADPALRQTAATGSAVYGPAQIFTSGQIDVTTQGTTGAGGSVTSTTGIVNVNRSGQEVFTAASLASRCTASETGSTGSTTIGGGRLMTSEGDPDVEGDETFVTLPGNPAPNTSYEGRVETVKDTYRYVFNEQVRNPDGSITVNAAHQYLLGPTAVGDLVIGQVRCAVTAAEAATPSSTGAGPTPGASTTAGSASGSPEAGTGGAAVSGASASGSSSPAAATTGAAAAAGGAGARPTGASRRGSTAAGTPLAHTGAEAPLLPALALLAAALAASRSARPRPASDVANRRR